MIDAMDTLQKNILGEIRAGVDYATLHINTHLKIAEILIDFELASGTPEALLESGVTPVFYPHGLGHLLGAQVHDVGGHLASENGGVKAPPAEHPFLRLTRVLEEDMVITIEPGLYFIDMLLDKLKSQPGADRRRCAHHHKRH
jgi:Xaa-Pro dipeptidase